MLTPSTRNLDLLPNIERLKKLLQSLAMLDAIMSPDWEDRYYSFDSKWSKKQQMGSMRTGSGDGFFALFNRKGCFLKGFAHEAAMTPYRSDPPQPWPGLLEDVPEEFAKAAHEPAFSMEDVTFCFWRKLSDSSWSHGPIKFPSGDDPDGSQGLLGILSGDPASYCRYAEDYFDTDVSPDAVQHVYDHEPLTKKVVAALNPKIKRRELSDDVAEIGYPK